MVAKISTGGNMFGALAYNQNKVDSEEAKVLFSNRMLLSEDGHFSIGECMRSFEMQMPVQLSTKKPILHISINPHPEDNFRTASFPTSHGSICGVGLRRPALFGVQAYRHRPPPYPHRRVAGGRERQTAERQVRASAQQANHP